MPAGNFYRVTLFGTHLGQLTINSFHYSAGEGVLIVDPPTFASNFATAMASSFVAMVSTAWSSFEIRIQDEDPSGIDYSSLSLGFAGAVSSSDDLPPFACWSFLMKRTQKTTFNGHKRFAGVPESWQTNGVITAGHSAAIATAEAGLAASVSDGISTFQPVIMSKYLNGVVRAAPVGNLIQSVNFKGITTQNSRKFGHGA